MPKVVISRSINCDSQEGSEGIAATASILWVCLDRATLAHNGTRRIYTTTLITIGPSNRYLFVHGCDSFVCVWCLKCVYVCLCVCVCVGAANIKTLIASSALSTKLF